MVIRLSRFNTYLLALAVFSLLTGCFTAESQRNRLITALGVHVEARPDASERSIPVTICRGNPIVLNVEKDPFLNESMVAGAAIFETQGGFAIQIQFDERGTRLLEQYSANNSGKHFAISCMFGRKPVKVRYVAAPLISRRIGNGILAFTPDADRAEAEQIVAGLNNLAKKTQPKMQPAAK